MNNQRQKLIDNIKQGKDICVFGVRYDLLNCNSNKLNDAIDTMLDESKDRETRLQAYRDWQAEAEDYCAGFDGVTEQDFAKVLDSGATILMQDMHYYYENYDETTMDNLEACLKTIKGNTITKYLAENLDLYLNINSKESLQLFKQKAELKSQVIRSNQCSSKIETGYEFGTFTLNDAFYKNNASYESFLKMSLIVTVSPDIKFSFCLSICNDLDSEHMDTLINFTADEVAEMLF